MSGKVSLETSFEGGTHKMPLRVYYHDTDAGGVVYHGSYLDFGERARTEFLRDMGYHHLELWGDENMIFIIRRMEVDYLLPGRLDDVLVVNTSILSIKNTSFVMKQDIVRGDDVIAAMQAVVVCIDAEKMRPVGIPEDLKKDLEDKMLATD